jgi:hypothetical protein
VRFTEIKATLMDDGPDGDVWLPFAETSPLGALDKYLYEHPEPSLA